MTGFAAVRLAAVTGGRLKPQLALSFSSCRWSGLRKAADPPDIEEDWTCNRSDAELTFFAARKAQQKNACFFCEPHL
jgi:hypothetical protein